MWWSQTSHINWGFPLCFLEPMAMLPGLSQLRVSKKQPLSQQHKKEKKKKLFKYDFEHGFPKGNQS